MEWLIFGSLVVAGSLLLGVRLRAQGRQIEGPISVLVALAILGSFGGDVCAAFVSFALWDFRIDPKVPSWSQYLHFGGRLLGSLVGIAAAFLIAARTSPAARQAFRDHAADYEDRGRRPDRVVDEPQRH